MRVTGTLLAFCTLLATAGFTQTAEPKYEMTNYVVGFLQKGPKWSPEVTEETKQIQAGHMAHIRKMADTGKLIVAGPFTDNGDLRGMLVFKDLTVDQARELANADPAVRAGRLRVELHPWFAAKGLNVPAPK